MHVHVYANSKLKSSYPTWENVRGIQTHVHKHIYTEREREKEQTQVVKAKRHMFIHKLT